MTQREIIGFCRCPVCGAERQEVRVNVNQKLYGYCDNGCAFKFNSAQSRKYLPVLRAGKECRTESGVLIKSIQNKELIEDEKQSNQFRADRNITGDNAGRRTDGQSAATTANTRANRRYGWLAGIFDDGDDDE